MEEKQKSGERKKDAIVCAAGVKMFAQFILKCEPRLAKFTKFKLNVPELEFVRRLTNTLVVCNHDVFILDFYAIPYLLRKYNIPLSIVVNEGFIQNYGTVFNDMTDKFSVSLISRCNAVPTIIEHINEGRTVVIFYDPNEYFKIEKRKSLPTIINSTKCRPVYLYYKTLTRIVKKAKLDKLNYFGYNFRSLLKFFLMSIGGQDTNIYIKVSENFDTYEEFIANKEFIKPIYLK